MASTRHGARQRASPPAPISPPRGGIIAGQDPDRSARPPAAPPSPPSPPSSSHLPPASRPIRQCSPPGPREPAPVVTAADGARCSPVRPVALLAHRRRGPGRARGTYVPAVPARSPSRISTGRPRRSLCSGRADLAFRVRARLGAMRWCATVHQAPGPAQLHHHDFALRI